MSVANEEDRGAAEEAELVAQIAAGDTGAPVTELYNRYGRRLYRFGVQALGNTGLAEEMVQECFVRLWRAAGRYDPGRASVGSQPALSSVLPYRAGLSSANAVKLARTESS